MLFLRELDAECMERRLSGDEFPRPEPDPCRVIPALQLTASRPKLSDNELPLTLCPGAVLGAVLCVGAALERAAHPRGIVPREVYCNSIGRLILCDSRTK